MYKGYSGIFTPKNQSKYRGDVSNIIFRSLLERKVMIFLDNHPHIIWWSSEETVIPYFNPLDNKWHRYFVDFSCCMKSSDGKVKKLLLEVKPEKFTTQPKQPKRKTPRYLVEMATFVTNKQKWEAADVWCKKNGFEFKIITEKDIKSKNK